MHGRRQREGEATGRSVDVERDVCICHASKVAEGMSSRAVPRHALLRDLLEHDTLPAGRPVRLSWQDLVTLHPVKTNAL